MITLGMLVSTFFHKRKSVDTIKDNVFHMVSFKERTQELICFVKKHSFLKLKSSLAFSFFILKFKKNHS